MKIPQNKFPQRNVNDVTRVVLVAQEKSEWYEYCHDSRSPVKICTQVVPYTVNSVTIKVWRQVPSFQRRLLTELTRFITAGLWRV